ncbi:myosin-M heavy chain-like isoform X1 [Lingula anatina]|uniref:Myosin-M heavy chain-like isoform X1 n=1 Tax=Lingula anatina TaxID=7574 RepID=A0A1S3HWM3_LINAN|nr:myosin-M heavy chain-like isoform X1 [Lingula anatina]|eukprot:XP_013390442.1 myosin-M heavy chain-like isoform X1 [Lingula anatina]
MSLKAQDVSKRKLSSATSKEEILSFLQEVQTGSFKTLEESSSLQSLEEIYEDDTSSEACTRGRHEPSRQKNRLSIVSMTSVDSGVTEGVQDSADTAKDTPKGAEVERVDSGVGSETKAGMKKKSKVYAGPVCEDCNKTISVLDLEDCVETLCTKCHSRRVERKETIQELVDTELSYGRDLRIIKEEFMAPMETASLLTPEQLDTIFINLQELIDINDKFADKLQDLVELANEQGDEDYVTVYIGQLFLESSNMFLAFENYCVKQAAAPLLLEQLEKEKELLRIFLHVSQTENSLLRRMNLKSFLMVPVQRIMKYPLLLGRLHKSTSSHHEDREAIKEAQCRVEEILDHINAKTKASATGLRLRRKGSGSKKSIGTDNIELNKVALETLCWTRNEVKIITAGKLQYAQPADSTWPRKYKNLKFAPIFGVLATLGNPKPYNTLDEVMLFPRPHTVPQQAALVIIREKGGRFQSIREPMYLDKCVVAIDPELPEVFEIHEMAKDVFLFKAEDPKDTLLWYRHLKYLSLGQGTWRHRRNGLANIMIKNKPKPV